MSGTYCNHKRLGGDIVDALSETRIVRDGNLELQDRNGNNAVIRDYAWGLHLGGGIGGLLNIRESSNNYHPLYDGKGNITALNDSTGAIVSQYRYGSFGKLEAKTGTVDQPFGFSTKRTDPKTGLVYYGYRFYHPDMERWLNRDPLGEEGGINLYEFVGNNPINWIDPWGLFAPALPLIPPLVCQLITYGPPLVIGVGIIGAEMYSRAHGQGERNWEKGRWDDELSHLSIDKLKEIERDRGVDADTKKRAHKIRKQKEKKEKAKKK